MRRSRGDRTQNAGTLELDVKRPTPILDPGIGVGRPTEGGRPIGKQVMFGIFLRHKEGIE